MGDNENGDAAAQLAFITQFNQLPDDKKLPTLQTLNNTVIGAPASEKSKTTLWTLLFAVLGILAIVLAVGAVILLIDGNTTGGALLLTPVTAILTGLIGLFAPTPTGQSS